MHKKFISLFLTLFLLISIVPMTALAAGTNTLRASATESFEDFAARIEREYDVKVTRDPSFTVSQEEQGHIESSLALWGKDFIRVVSAGFSKPGVPRQLEIRITKHSDYYNNAHASGMATENRIYLYPGWTYITVIHEIAHAVTFSWEAKALTDLFYRDMDVRFFKAMEKAHTENGNASYVPAACSDAGKAAVETVIGIAFENAYEDIAAILQNAYDSAWVARVQRGELPAEKAKIEVFRNFYGEYLTGGATPCPLVDSMIGPIGVSISSQPAASTTVIEGKIEESLSVATVNSADKKISYRWAISESNKFPGHGSLTQVKTATMEIPKNLKVGTYYYFCLIYVDGKEAISSNIAKVIVKADTSSPDYIDPSKLGLAINIISMPTKTNYVLGEGFDKTGFRAVYKYSNGTFEDYTDQIKFYTSGTVELTQGRPFQTTGKKEVELRSPLGKMRDKYTITVTEKSAPAGTVAVPAPTPTTPAPTATGTPTTPAVTTAKPTAAVTATPTNTKFMLNNAEVALPAYSIDNNNYVKLRDVGALLQNRFDVRWEDGKAKLYNHVSYTKISGELVTIGPESKSATLSNTDFVWANTGAAVTGLTAYNIADNNYIKLRDIAKLFDFDVDWRDGKAWIEPDVSPYTED